MKKAILFLAGLILLSFLTNAQTTTSSAKCFDENTRLINVGIGFGGGFYRGFNNGFGYYSSSTPAISVSYEQPYKKKLGPGFLGIGAYVGFQSSKYGYDNLVWNGTKYYYEHRYNNIIVAGRAIYHWDVLNTEKAEVYGGAIIGLRFQTYNYVTNYNEADRDYYRNSNTGAVNPLISALAGARWYFVPKVAVYGEVGYGISYLTIGATFKL